MTNAMIHRQIETSLQEDFGLGRVIVLLGARQVGKTTILESLSHGMDHLRLNQKNQVLKYCIFEAIKKIFLQEHQFLKFQD